MKRTTNRDRVLALIRAEPGLTDTEIRKRTGIEPHQQVNQICRSLASAGLTKRATGPDGRISNLPGGEAPAAPSILPGSESPTRTPTRWRREALLAPAATPLPTLQLADCLIVVPCSGSKRRGNAAPAPTSVLDALPSGLAEELSDRRRHNAATAAVDESTLLPATERYEGTFYKAGRSALKELIDRGARVLIISGGYGLVLAGESIGTYEQVFRPAMWPNRLIERCLAGFAGENKVRQVVGVLSASTGYSTVFRRTRWPRSVKDVFLASPESVPGAMVKAPRAQGEWLTAIAQSAGFPEAWTSSDGLPMEITHR